jgi:ring-1,2-phenylacetyl-CoA epoxidase subunit PaaC
MTREEALFKYTLRLGDNALILSQRLSEWCSYGPILEEDLALTNFALDLIGRAQAFLGYAAQLEGKGNTEDTLAFRRSERQYYNNQVAELPNGDFAFTMVRQLFISTFEQLLFTQLRNSKDETIAAVAAKTLKEVKYHAAHAADWVVRMGDGTDESNRRAQEAVDAIWPFTAEQFEMDEVDTFLLNEGIAADLQPLHAEWTTLVSATLTEAKLNLPGDVYMQTGSRNGIHTEHLGHLLSEMQYLQRAYPDAKW